MKGETVSSTTTNSHEHHHDQQEQENYKKKKTMNPRLLAVNCILLGVGQVGGPLLIRLYFLHGGQRKWLSSWLQTAAFPFLLIPIFISWSMSKPKSTVDANPNDRKLRFGVTRKLFVSSLIVGIIVGLDSFLYAFGLSYLPVSTSSLLMSTQLAFIAAFALVLVKQKFTPYSINSVVLLTLGSVVLAFHTDGDKPIGVSKAQYLVGFFVTLGAAALVGFMLPLIEFVYTKACVAITYDLVMRMQFLVSMFATLLCTIGMLINKDFQAISREAKDFGLGETKYYMVLIFTAVLMQCAIVGNLGVIYCSTSLLGGVLITLLIPVQQILAIFFFNEKFSAEKGMSLALCLWGFASYFYGEYKQTRNKKNQHKSPIDRQEIPIEV
ncbi:hypothetical protein MKW94_030516 [Papaver nudicaule]|uniref:Probable purine permease n=1 Tax=Papaver nudicaule TaxID=74823 RepID=A0AA41VBF0_PAPNU|nr:hypothetical protein [Papaver nudicaule]